MHDYLYKKIAGLIAKEMLEGLSPEEKEELTTWLNEDESNRKLMEEIKRTGKFKSWVHSYEADQHPAWQFIYATIQQKGRRAIIQKIFRVAASILIPLLIGGSVYFFVSRQIPEQTETHQQVAEINPGSSKAILQLDDGRSVILDTPGETEIREKDGTVIYKAERNLDYTGQKNASEAVRPLFNTIRIPRGAEYDLVLSDGTRVFLNAMSEFRYPVQFGEGTREVELIGEAYFEVTRSSSPFIVKTGGVDVEVVGTTFNVNAYENMDKVITTLVEGKVKVGASGKSNEGRLIEPEEQAVFTLEDG
ncbi:FecR family protein, partial [Mariniphaga sediminis]|uniref:FecR family protein n=1 Tax=Mariniphaga sediminis TaxID=1628158 RepID=UPI003565F1F7